MQPHRLSNWFSATAGRGFIAATQLATRRGWVRGPSMDADELGEGEHRYQVERTFLAFDPEAHPVENCHEMVFDREGRLYLLTDHPKNNVLVFERDGRLANAFTFGMEGAHGLSIATRGTREHLLVCDPYGGRVVETTLDGTLVRTFPSPHELGIYGAFEPYAPTQSAQAPNGDVYVADGYGSQRVLRFDAGGRFVASFGGAGHGDGEFDYAHGIAIDARRGPGHETLLVTSRADSCLQRFDLEGRFLGRIPLPGGYPCRPVIRGQEIYLGLCWSGAHLRANSGFVVVLGADDRVKATLGGRMVQVGETTRLESEYSVFRHVHDVAVDADGHLFVAQWNAGRTPPFRLRRLPPEGR